MKRVLIIGSILTLFLGPTRFMAEDSSPSDEALTRRLELYDIAAIKIIATERRTNLIPALERIANAPISPEEPSRIWARKALAKLGVERAFNAIIQDIQTPTESADYPLLLRSQEGFGFAPQEAAERAANEVRGNAMDALIYLQEPASVKVVAPMLYEKERPNLKSDELMPPQSVVALLCQMNLPDAPRGKFPVTYYAKPEEIQAWQHWWEQHKDYYEKIEFGKPLPSLPAVPTNSSKTQSNPISPPRPSQPTTGEAATSSAFWLYPLIIGGVVLGGFVAWLLVRRRKSH